MNLKNNLLDIQSICKITNIIQYVNIFFEKNLLIFQNVKLLNACLCILIVTVKTHSLQLLQCE